MRTQYPDYGHARFARDVTEHELTILHDDGLYRHLLCARHDTSLGHFDIVTWPGYLHVGGDRDGYTFCRVEDMFEFFRPRSGWNDGRVNPLYWSEKITDGLERAHAYSRRRAETRIWSTVRDEYQTTGKKVRGLARAVKGELIDDRTGLLDFEETARQAIAEFRFTTKAGDVEFSDVWEWNLRDWSHHYLWSCHAIRWGVTRYDQAKTATSERVGGGRD